MTVRHIATLGLALALGAPPVPSSVDYTLRVESAASSEIVVVMRIHGAPADFRVAMATHPEYDDRYWRYLTDLTGESARGPVTLVREDSAVWRATCPPGDVTIRYRVRFPSSLPTQQAAWMGHLTPTGGLVGGPHSFLYVVGREHAPVHVTLALPAGWSAATGLEGDTASYAAPDAETLIDSPIMVGRLRSWRFSVDGIPHDITWLGTAAGTSFDTTTFVASIERLARETVRMFGTMPYHRYQFLFEDATYGGLEHVNSVSIGTQSGNLARDQAGALRQIAHEYFHTWNEVHVRPAAWIGLRHVLPAPTGELWFSEGVTLYYADLLLRRSRLPTPDSTRQLHLERLLATYFANPSHAAVSPEATSRAFNLQPATGDFTPSMFVQGELLGAVLDFMIRDASRGARSLDDVMRTLAARFTPARGFVARDVDRAVAEACGCDARPFFAAYVQSAAALDFDRWLGLIGLRSVVAWNPARSPDGSAVPDIRVSSYSVPGDQRPRVQVWFPSTAWGHAGLHTGDRLISWYGSGVDDPQQVRAALGRLRIGDTGRVTVARGADTLSFVIPVTGYDRPTVRIVEREDATGAQRRLRAAWLAGS
jgi:predicted metalloprotease with PDZ domain